MPVDEQVVRCEWARPGGGGAGSSARWSLAAACLVVLCLLQSGCAGPGRPGDLVEGFNQLGIRPVASAVEGAESAVDMSRSAAHLAVRDMLRNAEKAIVWESSDYGDQSHGQQTVAWIGDYLLFGWRNRTHLIMGDEHREHQRRTKRHSYAWVKRISQAERQRFEALLSRWQTVPEQRKAVNNGNDIFTQWTFLTVKTGGTIEHAAFPFRPVIRGFERHSSPVTEYAGEFHHAFEEAGGFAEDVRVPGYDYGL